MKKISPFAVIIAGSLLLNGCSQKKMNTDFGPPEVLITEPLQRNVPIKRTWVGSLDGFVNAEIRARVQGYLTKQNYKEGSFVKTGDVLFEIDPRPFQAALEQAKADLLKAQATQLNAELTEKRQLELFNKNVVSQADRDTAVQNSAAAKAATEAAQAALDQAQLNLDYTKVLAPVDGIAGIAVPGIGDLVGPSTPAMTTVSTVDPIKANFQLSEQEYLKIADKVKEFVKSEADLEKRVATLELILTDGSTYPHKGKVFTINRQVDVKTGTIQIETIFPNPERILRPGQFALVNAQVRVDEGALLVPQRAVMEIQGSYQLIIIGADNKPEFRPVKVGERTGSDWVIAEGLKPGEKVVVEGLQKVRKDVAVNAKPWTRPEGLRPPDTEPSPSPAPAEAPAQVATPAPNAAEAK